MKTIKRFRVLSVFFILAYLLAACSGIPVQTTSSAKGPKAQPNVVAFTGTVEAMNGTEWTISGQKFTLDPQTLPDPTIVVGDKVKVEATVFAEDVVATKVEYSETSNTVLDVLSTVLGTPYKIEVWSPDPGATRNANENKSAENGNSSDDSSNHDNNDNHGRGGNSGSGG